MDANNIFKRPSSSDSEADLVKFQKVFLAEKSKNTNFEPAAKVVRLTNPVENPGCCLTFDATRTIYHFPVLKSSAKSFTICEETRLATESRGIVSFKQTHQTSTEADPWWNYWEIGQISIEIW